MQASPYPTTRLHGMSVETDTQRLYASLKEYQENPFSKTPLWIGYFINVALDHIMDPQNVGAILRSAGFFGVDGIIMTERFTAPLSPWVSKASSGALERASVYTTTNLANFLTVNAFI